MGTERRKLGYLGSTTIDVKLPWLFYDRRGDYSYARNYFIPTVGRYKHTTEVSFTTNP